MKLERPIIFFDIESTGTDTQKDRIVTLCAHRYEEDFEKFSTLSLLCNPGILMSEEVIACHGITNEKVADAPPFAKVAVRVYQFFVGCDLGGFNLINFDVPMLWEEVNRCGLQLDLSAIHVVDVGNIFKKKEERTLSAAVKFFCGRDHVAAHSADGDVAATMDVFFAQQARYQDLIGMDVPRLAAFSRMDERIDLAGIVVRNKQGEAVYGTKRNRGVRLADDPGYAQWMLRSDFSEQTKQVIRSLLAEVYSEV